MPGSVTSATTCSGSSSSSRRAKTRQYRTISNTSHVDEILFGTPNHVATNNRNANNEKTAPVEIENVAKLRNKNRKHNQKPNKESVQIITKDLIRSLIVPTEDPSGRSIILTNNEYARIKDKAVFYTKDEKQAMLYKLNDEKLKKQEESSDRKTHIKIMDMNRQKNEKLSELDEEVKEQSEHLLKNAVAMRHEQEDEIKRVNELILNAKCHAIRDAQMLEKEHIVSEISEEEKRLDLMMEVERQNGIIIQEEIEKRKKEERLLGAAKIMEQISDNEQERLFELERKDQENVQIQKTIMKMMDEDHDSLLKKKTEQDVMRETLNKANELQQKQRVMKAEQEMMEDRKVAQYTKEKAEREAAYEAEQERIRIEKEKETTRLRALQERASDEQAGRDALRAKRAQEKAERDWRKKEAEEERKKQETNEMLSQAREKQMEQKERVMAVQAQQERVEFERVLQAQKELIEKDRRNEHAHQTRGQKYAKELRQQVSEKEHDRIQARNAFFEEGVKLDEEARDRRQRLDEVKRKKLDSLRDAGIPEKYISQVQRKIDLAPQKVA